MKARVAIQIGVSPTEWKLLKKAAQARGLQLAPYVRWAALQYAATVDGEIDLNRDTVKAVVLK